MPPAPVVAAFGHRDTVTAVAACEQENERDTKSRSLRVAFLGTGEIGVPSLKWLAGSPDVDLVGVVTQPDRPAGRRLSLTPPPVKVAALALGLPVFQPARLREEAALEVVRAWSADLFVVAAYGQILSPAALAVPLSGCLNIHASLLPRHRGASPIQAAILSGDLRTGVTIMWMDEGLDTGDILLAHECGISDSDTAGMLHDRLAQMAPDALAEALRLVAGGRAPRIPQDPALVTHSRKISRADGRVDWLLPAGEVLRRMRAYAPWPGSFTMLPDGRRLIIHSASAVAATDVPPGVVAGPGEDGLLVGTGKGVVALTRVQLEGSKPVPALDFARGHTMISGVRFV